MAREPFNEIWANSPDPAQFEEPPAGTFASGWEGGPAANPPEAKWENWWHNRVDVALQQLERGGYLDYDSGAVYEEGAIARGSDGAPYRSQQGSNQGNDPATDAGTFWVREPAGIATAAEAQALSSLSKLLTPGRLVDAFRGANFSDGSVKAQRLPSGVIIQWGSTSPIDAGNTESVSLPITYVESIDSIALGVRRSFSATNETNGEFWDTIGLGEIIIRNNGSSSRTINFVVFGR